MYSLKARKEAAIATIFMALFWLILIVGCSVKVVHKVNINTPFNIDKINFLE